MAGILVFGGNRATGLEIVKALKARGDDVSVMARPSADTAAVRALGVPVIVGQASSVTPLEGQPPFVLPQASGFSSNVQSHRTHQRHGIAFGDDAGAEFVVEAH